MESYFVLLAPRIDPGPGGGRREVRAPVLLDPDAPALVVDVLRATTTLTVAMRNGAARVLEAATPEEGFALQARHPGALLPRDPAELPRRPGHAFPAAAGPERQGCSIRTSSTAASMRLLVPRSDAWNTIWTDWPAHAVSGRVTRAQRAGSRRCVPFSR